MTEIRRSELMKFEASEYELNLAFGGLKGHLPPLDLSLPLSLSLCNRSLITSSKVNPQGNMKISPLLIKAKELWFGKAYGILVILSITVSDRV